MYRQLQSLAIQQIRDLGSDMRLIIVHPNFLHQHALLGELFDIITVYHRFDPGSSTALENQLAVSVEEQVDSHPLPDNATIVLDECDSVNAQEFEVLLRRLLASSKTSRLFLFTRSTPQAILKNPELHKISTFVPVDEPFLLLNYAAVEPEAHFLEVRSFGEGRVLLNGKLINEWDGILPRSLFFYLVDRGMATRAEIFTTFWPDLSSREATNVFHVTKRKISEILGIDLTTYWSGFYRISPNIQLSYDVVRFSELLQTSAIADPDEAKEQLQRAVALYHDRFLSSMDLPWATQRRDELAMDYAESLKDLGDLLVQSGNIDEAIGFYLRAITISQDRDLIAERVLKLYKDTHQHKAAIDLCRQMMELNHNSSNSYGESLQELVALVKREMGHSVA